MSDMQAQSFVVHVCAHDAFAGTTTIAPESTSPTCDEFDAASQEDQDIEAELGYTGTAHASLVWHL